jgi:hypothetical protein
VRKLRNDTDDTDDDEDNDNTIRGSKGTFIDLDKDEEDFVATKQAKKPLFRCNSKTICFNRRFVDVICVC